MKTIQERINQLVEKVLSDSPLTMAEIDEANMLDLVARALGAEVPDWLAMLAGGTGQALDVLKGLVADELKEWTKTI